MVTGHGKILSPNISAQHVKPVCTTELAHDICLQWPGSGEQLLDRVLNSEHTLIQYFLKQNLIQLYPGKSKRLYLICKYPQYVMKKHRFTSPPARIYLWSSQRREDVYQSKMSPVCPLCGY